MANLAFTASAHQPAAERIRAALAKPITVNYTEMPLSEVVADLRVKLHVPIQLDFRALNELAIATDGPITFSAKGISAKSVLTLILREVGLVYLIENDVLSITSPQEAELPDRLVTRIYDVTDLVTPEGKPEDQPDFSSLIELITSIIRPQSWDCVGGPGSIHEFPLPALSALAITQTEWNHEAVAALLADLRTVRKFHEKKTTSPEKNKSGLENSADGAGNETPLRPAPVQGVSAFEQSAQQPLAQPLTVKYVETPLSEVSDDLEKKLALPVRLDHRALDELAVATDTPVTFSVSGIPAKSALNLMMRELGLTYQPYCEILSITSQQEVESPNRDFIRVYDVSDLPAYRDEQGRGVPDFVEILDFITLTVAPQSWDAVGGLGSIREFQNGSLQVLVVSQTWQIHERIEQLLSDLRKLRKRPLTKADVEKLPREPVPQIMYQPSGFHPPSSRKVKPLPPLERDPLREAVVAGNNELAFQFYGKLSGGKPENVFFSPYSIATALAMVQAGARGQTAREIGEVLHLELPQADVPKAFAALQKALPEEGLGCQWRVANRLWYQQGRHFKADFAATLQDAFQADLGFVDFGQPEAARQAINHWVEEATKQRIHDLFPPGGIRENTLLALTNAVYFQGSWESPFPERNTKQEWFYAPRKTLRVPMMSQEGMLKYGKNDAVQMVSLPYRGRNVSMLILLPENRAGALEALENRLSAETVAAMMKKLKTEYMTLCLPRFTLHMGFPLPEVLQSLGMKSAFDAATADFGGISDEKPLWLNNAFHQAFVRVDEKGTEAAAATGLGCFGGPLISLRADHPFLFLIYDHRTGSILFLGKLVEPVSEERSPESKGMGMF
ncbi:MAG: serpin family protein [Pirellulales bacterium]|nr:serpin family protein [Pirellulales bacterium]